jgi:iron complex outermembrane receptor protein
MKKIYLGIFIMIIPFIMFSQEVDTLNIEEILIKGIKTNDNFETPITGDNIKLINPHDGGEIFKYTPGFSILKKGNYAMEPVLRGFKYEQINVQFDGGVHSTNACPNRMDPGISQISIEEIEKVEVIKGPYNVRFGPALSGIINIISRRPERTGKIVKGWVEGGYQSNGNNWYTSLFTQLVKKKWDFAVSAGYKDYGNYESGDGTEIISSFYRGGYTIKAGYNINEKQRLQLSLRQSFARDVMYPGLPMDAKEDNSVISALDYAATDITNTIISLKAKFYFSYVDHLMVNWYRPAYKNVHAETPVTAQNFGGRFELGLNVNNNNVLYAGVDFQYVGKDGSRSRKVYTNTCATPPINYDPPKQFYDKVWQDSYKNDVGIFIEDRFKVNSRLLWQVGFRLDVSNYDIRDPEQDFYELYKGDIKPDVKVDPTINSVLTYRINDNWNIQWPVAMAKRSPELTELFINHLSVGMDAYEYVGNPSLKSETNYQTDFIVQKSGKIIMFYIDGYFSYLNNYISAVVDTTIPRKYMPCKPPEFTKQFRNVDKAYMTGFEAGLNVNFLKHFDFNFNASYTIGQNISFDEPLSEIPPFTVNAGIKYSLDKFTVSFNSRIAAKQDRVSLSFNEATSPGFQVFNLFLTYSPWKFLDIYGSITNIFNENYAEHLNRPYKAMDTKSPYYEPGRSCNISLTFKF